MTEGQKPPILTTPERLFKSLSGWIGLSILVASMFYAFERGIEVHWAVYVIGGSLMGVGKALEIAERFKP